MRMRRRYPLAVLLVLLAALVVALALATSAMALPTFTQTDPAHPTIGPCEKCHSMSQVHGVPAHASMVGDPAQCVKCHNNGGTGVPPLPTACGACHGGKAQIIIAPTHVTTGCSTTPGCHGVPSAAAQITSITPSSGAIGTTVTIAGSGFGATQGAGTVKFGTTVVTTVTSWADTKIVVAVPAGLIAGAVDVVVTPAGGTASAGFPFTVTTVTTVTSKIGLKLVGVKAGILKFGRALTAKGTVTPFHATKVTITFQRKKAGKWVTMKKVTRMSNATTGVYSFKYKPGKKGAWRSMSAAAKVTVGTTTYTLAKTKWKLFKVK